VATGYFGTPKKLGVPGEGLPHVSPYYRDPLPYYAQDVLIVGGKNSAVEAALDLWRHGARVTVVHRGAALSSGVKYWILPDFENRVSSGAIDLLTSTTVAEFRPGSTVLRRSDGSLTERPTDFAYTLIGYEADVRFLRECGIGIVPETGGPVYDPATMETDVPGLYVAGGMVGGRMNNKIFIENGRLHGRLIVDAVAGD
jgi:thioredoxin reductase (NADPH)